MEKMIDPACGMKVGPAKAAGHADHGGKTYYFCSKNCLGKFNADPARYAAHVHAGKDDGGPKHGSHATAVPPAGAQYTCPMHP